MVAEEEAAVVAEEDLIMTSHIPEITLITERYFFLKTSLTTHIENKLFRKKKLEQKARKAIMKFSKHDEHSLTSYLYEVQNELTAWIHLAIAECSKIRKQKQRGKA
ncbi:MAG TPA: hypothetical protein VLD84_09065 [Nitrososphaeraceae archaeon]|nr:hypothetical protein [Nitrososphaeraceae archaeon]